MNKNTTSNSITVSVTQENIDKGVARACTFCPIALALRDLGDRYSYIVNGRSLYNIHHERVAYLPLEASWFVQDFDAGRHVDPFTFEVSFLN